MAKTLQHRRDSTSNLASVAGAEGEIFIDLTKNTVVVMDGATNGGHPLAKESAIPTDVSQLTDTTGLLGGGSSNTDHIIAIDALIGDVAIVGNTITGVDSYGLPTELIVDGNLKVSATTAGIGEITLSTLGTGALYYMGNITFATVNGFTTQHIQQLSTITIGSTLIFNNVQVLGLGAFDTMEVIVSQAVYDTISGALVISVSQPPQLKTGGVYQMDIPPGSGFIAQTYTFTGSTVVAVNPLSVTAAGVNIDGALTINGLPLPTGGSSYDQSLNTTDAVVFDSALLGNVSVIGNTISALDTYGLPSTLNVDGALTVNGIPLTGSDQSLNTTDAVVFDSVETQALDVHIHEELTTNYDFNYEMMGMTYGNFSDYSWDRRISVYNYSGNNTQLTTYLLSKHVGDTLYFTVNTPWGQSVGYGVISTINGGVNDLVNVYFSNIVYTSGYNVAGNSFSIQFGSYVTDQYVFDAIPLSVDRNGVVLSGVTTADDIIATSGLIGDVSIIGNNIAALDTYGLPGILNVSTSGLVFDSNLNLSVDTLVSTTDTITDSMNYFSITQSVFRRSNPDFLYASKFVTGSIVTLTDYMYYTTVTIRLTSDMTYNSNDNTWSSTYTIISGSIAGSGQSQNSIVTVVNTTGGIANYGFDDQGVLTAPKVSTTELLINGVAPTFLTSNLDGSKSVAVDSTNTVYYNASSSSPAPIGYLVFSGAIWNVTQFILNNPDSNTLALFNSLVAGDTITLGDSMSGGTPYTLTLAASGSTFNGLYNGYEFSVVESNLTGMGISFGSQFGVTIVSASVTNFNFGTDGVLTTDTLHTTDALIGDVSIVGNTIAALDAYGLPGDLVLDGTVVYTSETTLSPTNTTTPNKWLQTKVQVPNVVTTITNTQFSVNTSYTSGSYDSNTLTLNLDTPSNPDLIAWLNDANQNKAVSIRALISGYGWYDFVLSGPFTQAGSNWSTTVNSSPIGGTFSVEAYELPVISTSINGTITETFYMPLYK